MADRTFRQRPERAAVYWRRRVVVLTLTLSALAGLTWTAATVVGGATRPAKAAAGRAQLQAQAGHRALSAAVAPGGATAYSNLAAPVRLDEPSCPATDVALRLTVAQATYPAWQQPEFAVDVVSIASGSCSFDIGSRYVLLQITAGATRVWTSADCAEGLASQPVTLRRGVPVVVPMAWDEQYSSAGCPVPGQSAAAGSYTATATDGSAISNGVTFQIA